MLLPVSHQRQRRQADCLATCAAMVLAYLQVPIQYTRLLRLLQVDKIGTPFRNLSNLESLGLSVSIVRSDIDMLRTFLELRLPVITAVDTAELTSYWPEKTEHAVVVIGIEADVIHLDDPAFDTAPHTVSINEFALAWQVQDNLGAVIALDDL